LSIGKDFIRMFGHVNDGLLHYETDPSGEMALYNIRYTHFGIFSVLL